MPRGNVYLSVGEVGLLLGALDSMVESLPNGEDVPNVDRKDAERDRRDYEALRAKIAEHA